MELTLKWSGDPEFNQLIKELTKEFAQFILNGILGSAGKHEIRHGEMQRYSISLLDKILEEIGRIDGVINSSMDGSESGHYMLMENKAEMHIFLANLSLSFVRVYLNHWGNGEKKIEFYDRLKPLVERALTNVREAYDKAERIGDWKRARYIMGMMVDRYGEVFSAHYKCSIEDGSIGRGNVNSKTEDTKTPLKNERI